MQTQNDKLSIRTKRLFQFTKTQNGSNLITHPTTATIHTNTTVVIQQSNHINSQLMLSAEKYKGIFVEIASMIMIIVFCYAAVSKLSDVPLFRLQMSKSPLLVDYAAMLSWAVPITELVVATLLAFRLTRLPGLYFSLLLMILFTTYIIIILNFSYYIPCSCGGILQGLSWKVHLAFNSFLLLVILPALIFENSKTHKEITLPLSPFTGEPGEAENLQKRVGTFIIPKSRLKRISERSHSLTKSFCCFLRL